MHAKQSDLIMICTSDIAGQLRGKAVPKSKLEARRAIGIGWTPTNALITSFGPIADSPWGALGDLFIKPDLSTKVDLNMAEYGVHESFIVGDICELDGSPWTCCLRSQLSSAIDRLEAEHDLHLRASFEHEFHYSGSKEQPGLGYSLRAFRRLREFPDRLMNVLEAAGLGIDTFMPEYGPSQFEVTIDHQPALQAADQAVILRELVRATASGLDARASFTPILGPSEVGNGVHIHFSLHDSSGYPKSFAAETEHGVSSIAASFIAGILKYMPDFLPLTAASVPSYYRLTPHRWSTAFNNLGRQDREAAVRICPVFGAKNAQETADKFHFEYRAADATASPYLALSAIINAGISGLREELPVPTITSNNISSLSEAELAAIGCERLPQNLETAIARLSGSDWASATYGEVFIDTFRRHKEAEIGVMSELTPTEICRRYYEAY